MKTSKFFEFGFATKRELNDAINGLKIIDGEVNTYADLPTPTNHNGEIWIVKTTTGVIFVNKKVAGLYVSNGTTWTIITPVEIDGYQKLITTPTDGNVVITDANGQTQNGNKKLDDLEQVLSYDNFASFPATGNINKIYIAKDANTIYRWNGTQYVVISSSLVFDTVSTYTLAYGTGQNLNVITDKFSIITVSNGDAFVNLPSTLNNSGKVMKIRSDLSSIGRLYINGSEKGTNKYFILGGDTAIFECDNTSWKLITGVNYKVPFLGSGRQNSGRGLIFALEEKLMCFGIGDQWQPGHIYSPVNYSYTATELPILNTDGTSYTGTITGWKEILCSHENAIALTNEGDVFVWGAYWADGGGGRSRFPKKQTFPAGVIIDKVFMSIERNYNNAMSFFALSTTGKLYSWGDNSWGQLGLGDTTNKNNPTLITALQNKVIVQFSVSGNYGMSCGAIDDTGQLYTWGYGGSGSNGNPLGNNTSGGDVTTPTAISGITNASDVLCIGCYPFSISGAGYRGYTRILRTDGSSWATGYNGAGNLAINNTTIDIKVFTREAQNKTNIIKIEGGSGYAHGISCIVDADFKVYFAGSNQRGIFGRGDGEDTIQFVLNATQLSAGFQGKMYSNRGITARVKIVGHNDTDQINCFILDGDGGIYVSGFNSAGVCGDGTTSDRNIFNKVKFPTNRRVVDFMPIGWQAETSNRGIVVVFEDGTMMSWGQNTNGALGNQIYPSNTVMNYPIYVIGYSPNDINEVN